MIYVTGATGQLGNELRKILSPDTKFLTREQLDLGNLESVENFLKKNKIDLLINAAAYTQVDGAESHRALASLLNSEAPRLMSRYSAEKRFKFIHFSTDYVFNGRGVLPYTETDSVEPVNYYGKTKLDGEIGILNENPESLIIRTSWVYSMFGKNFINTILKLGSDRSELNVVFDQVGTLTSAKELAEVTFKARDLRGIYHFSNEGVCSWYDVAVEIKRATKFKADIKPILSDEYPTAAKRPHYSVLNKNKIKNALGISIPHWTESLELCLQKLS
jgi:dTDP-4-dehydrorhamnose reductase